MKLKKLEILGFKSFADKTKLSFHEGITAVVGPNGCGKSNIADAFRWVMGEQSAKSLRGGKMPDVIFAGTAQRKPLNFAEVTITLDEIGDKLPVDYEEVSIGRRLHRSGESEYFINRQQVRLKDIQSLLLDSGMGKDAYSIFEQGKIDQVINLSPIERRYIFEEAAGILRFLQRKKEALHKLEQTDLNVSRVKDIHAEVEKHIIVLEEQAAKALQYKQDKLLLEALEKGLLVAKWENIQKRLSEARYKNQDAEGLITSMGGQIEVFAVELAEAKIKVASSEKALRARSEEVYLARSAKEVKFKERQNHQERLKELSNKEKRWQHELEAMLEKKRLRVQDRVRLQKAQEAITGSLGSVEELLKGQREKATLLDMEVSKERKQQQSVQQGLLAYVQSEGQCASELKQITLRIENGKEKQELLQERLLNFKQKEEDLLKLVEEKTRHSEESALAVEGQKEIFFSMEQRSQELNEEIKKTQGRLNNVQVDLVEAKARYKVLQRLQEDMEGFSSGSKKLLQEALNEKSPLFRKIKKLYEYIVPQEGAEAAIALALKGYAQTLVVETETDFQEVLAFAKQHRLKDFSLLSLETLLHLPSSSRPASCPKELTSLAAIAIQNSMTEHFLKNAYLAKTADVALKAIVTVEGIEVVVVDGLLIDRHGVVFYAAQGENNAFLREAEIKSTQKKIEDHESEKQQVELVLKEMEQKKNLLQSERIELDKSIRRNEMKLLEVNFSLQKLKADLEQVFGEQRSAKTESQQVLAALEEQIITLNDLGKRYESAKVKAQEAKQLVESQHVRLEEQLATFQQETKRLQTIELEHRQLTEEGRKLAHALHVLEVKDIESAQQEKRLEEEIEMGRHLQSQIHENSSDVDKALVEVEQSLADVMATCKELESEVSMHKGVIEHLEAKIQEKQTLLKKKESERHQTGILAAQLESVGASIETELLERHHLPIERAQQECEKITQSLDAAEKQIRALRQQMENAGNINMTSIEECERHKERYQFLNQQMDDLHLSKQELIAMITQLDGESRKIFKATFDQIRQNFKKNFSILFHGGEADLQFTDTADVLEAGIEISAKPPGKQMRSITLLSGGEKCLTAMALLFAIFEVKPAPFCILDEIDAPLDDTNVERFVNIVKEFVDRCQFIIITHNKRTMAIADMLFGVSMEERGVSKLLSMDFLNTHEPKVAAVAADF